jgi:DNA-binding protein
MSQQENNSLNLPELEVEKLESRAKTAEGTEVPEANTEPLEKVAMMRYVAAMTQLKMVIPELSVRSLGRAITNAIDLPVASGVVMDFVKKEEAEVAGLIAQIIDLRMLIQAQNMKKEDQTNSKGENTNDQEK